ncbi:MAG: wax ester/triacylglycerol synthase family O-acyltransferase [Actinobacteria bacterium]|nr:wax ester/triacylglycerol synthase family O-acyltransferase [Actinomycetota bacterium]
MPDRLSPLDVSFLYLEEPTTPMHVGSVMILEPPRGGLDFDRLVQHVAARIALVPRYRQRVRWVPARLGNPVWVDDERFDISYHVRRSALPRPGTPQQLAELVARLQARPLDRGRPLWELILVEGLADGRVAVVTKVHQALVDGVHAVDLGQVVLDASADHPTPPTHTWSPSPEPSSVELVVSAVADAVRRPQAVVDTVRAGVGDARETAGKAFEALTGLVFTARSATRSLPRSPLNRDVTEHRRFAMVATDLEDYRRIRNHLLAGPANRRRRRVAGGRDVPVAAAVPAVTTSVNDVVLATLAGALRAWLLTRGASVQPASVVRALVPMSMRVVEPGDSGAVGSRVGSLLVDLPTGEASPLMRVHQVAYQTKAHREAGQAVAAPALAGLAGFAPPTLHSLGARVASGLSHRLFNLVVTNVPGPQQPLYVVGARMLSTYPVIPLARSQSLAIGLTSYDGGVYYGLNADREAMPDLEVLAQCIKESLAELKEAAR